MAFQLSPGVLVTEKDLTSIIPAVATSTGAFAGVFQWGPVLDPVTITNEVELRTRFGLPNEQNAASFFTAANFLAYSNNLLTVRVDTTNAKNAVTTQSGSVTDIAIDNTGAGYVAPVVVIGQPDVEGGIQATATATINGDGEIIDIQIVNAGSGYVSAPSVSISSTDGEGDPQAGADFAATASIVVAGVKVKNLDQYTSDGFVNGGGTFGEWAAKYPGKLGNSIIVSMADVDSYENWEYASQFDSAPGTSNYADRFGAADDEMHIIVIDADGTWTGTAGSVLEKFAFVSKASDAMNNDGSTNYYKNVINSSSRYVWWMDHRESTNWGLAAADGTTFDTMNSDYTVQLSGGVDDFDAVDGNYIAGFALFANDELYDVSLIPTGKVSATVAKYVIENVAEVRKDCVAFVSPIGVTGSNAGAGQIIKDAPIADMVEDTVLFRTHAGFATNSSYGVLDSGFKYQYDRYNDRYVWVPLNGDIAGLCARTDYTNDPWWSPGGLNRGQVKNVVKLAVNPGKTYRDQLYINNINPVVTFPGEGTVLFGDKTLLKKPSAFDRINVRRLFIVLEKAIATAAKYQLFEFNDSFTRAMFKNMVEPFLRDVQGRRGIIDFRVKCDDTNNTGEVIDRNEFVADIYIKPARSINFITLNFIAARTAVSFDEIGA